MKLPVKILILVLFGALFSLLPRPEGLTTNAWYYFAIFLTVIIGLILEPLPAAAISFIGVTLVVSLGLMGEQPAENITWGLTGFSNTTVWLIFGAFMLCMGYQRSGLGHRLALSLMSKLGRSTLGLGYAIALGDLVLAPMTPSNTARSAGTIFPIIQNIPPLYQSKPGATARNMGAYIMWTAFAITAVTSSMFLTALAPNMLALSFVEEIAGIEVTWMQWLIGFLPIGLILFFLVPLLGYWLYPPAIKQSPEIPLWASQELKQLGNLSREEIKMIFLIGLALSLWIFGRNFIHTTSVVWIVISLMLISKVISWQDVISNSSAWNMLVWFATLVTLANGLNQLQIIDWLAKGGAHLLVGYSPQLITAGLVAIFFMIHYLFASLTAHTTAIFPVFLAIGMAIPELPLISFVLLLSYSIGLMGVITPYATGSAPVYFGSGYITPRAFWTLGFVFGMVYLIALLFMGTPYLHYLYEAS